MAPWTFPERNNPEHNIPERGLSPSQSLAGGTLPKG
jgi:hypothetical protein